jgi:outer membrane lipase/esterase
MTRKMLSATCSTIILAAAWTAPVAAEETPDFGYTEIYAFGDSLTDTGNLYASISVPGFPYFDGRFSNGPVWIEPFSGLLFGEDGDDRINNFAIGGATTGLAGQWDPLVGDMTGLWSDLQVGAFGVPDGLTLDGSELVTIWAGANDYFAALPYLAAGHVTPEEVIGQTVTNIATAVGQLKYAGGQSYMVLNLPSLGDTPLAAGLGAVEPLNALTAGHNSTLATATDTLRGTLGVEVIYVDVEVALNHVLASPALFGFSNSTDACLSMPGVCFADPNSFVFWDGIHPTAATHKLLAEFAYATLVTTREGVQVASTQASVAALTSMAGLRAVSARQNAVNLGLSQQVVFGNRFIEASPIEQRLAMAGRSDATATQLSLSPDGMPMPAIDSPFGMYLYGETDDGEQAATDSQIGLGYHTEQTAVGMDYRLTDSLMVGMVAGFAEGEGLLAGGMGSSSVESTAFTIYGSLNGENGHIDASVGQSREQYAGLTRNTGSRIFPTARAESEGLTTRASLSGGYDWHTGPVTWGPVAGLDYGRRQIDGYHETGAGPLNLAVAEQTDESLVASIGLQASAEFAGDWGATVMQGGLSYEQDFLGGDNWASAQLAGNAAVTDLADAGDAGVMKLAADVGVRLDGGITATLENSLELTEGGDPEYAGMAWVKLTF